MYVRDQLPCHRLTSYENIHLDVTWVLFRLPRMPRSESHIAVGTVYYPPSADGRLMINYLCDCMDRLTKEHPHAGVVLLSDFNQLQDTALLSYPLKQVVRAATRGSVTLDKIYTNISEWYQGPFSIPPIGRSDHNAIVMLPGFVDPRPLPTTSVSVVHRLNPSGKALLQQAVQQINWSPLYCLQNPNDMVTLFNSTVIQLIDQVMVPHVTRES